MGSKQQLVFLAVPLHSKNPGCLAAMKSNDMANSSISKGKYILKKNKSL